MRLCSGSEPGRFGACPLLSPETEAVDPSPPGVAAPLGLVADAPGDAELPASTGVETAPGLPEGAAGALAEPLELPAPPSTGDAPAALATRELGAAEVGDAPAALPAAVPPLLAEAGGEAVVDVDPTAELADAAEPFTAALTGVAAGPAEAPMSAPAALGAGCAAPAPASLVAGAPAASPPLCAGALLAGADGGTGIPETLPPRVASMLDAIFPPAEPSTFCAKLVLAPPAASPIAPFARPRP